MKQPRCGNPRIMEHARHTFENNPRPLSPAIVKGAPGGFALCEPEGRAAELLRSLHALDAFISYRDQQGAANLLRGHRHRRVR